MINETLPNKVTTVEKKHKKSDKMSKTNLIITAVKEQKCCKFIQCFHLCRHYQHSPNPAPPPTQMPKYIKMGTTNLAANCPAKLGIHQSK